MPFSSTFFDSPVDRRGSDSLKWGIYADRDILPLWVADMDFRSAPAIAEALTLRARHGVYGYAKDSPADENLITGFHFQI